MLAVEASLPEELGIEALSLGELPVEAPPVTDASPVGEVVLDPTDDTG